MTLAHFGRFLTLTLTTLAWLGNLAVSLAVLALLARATLLVVY